MLILCVFFLLLFFFGWLGFSFCCSFSSSNLQCPGSATGKTLFTAVTSVQFSETISQNCVCFILFRCSLCWRRGEKKKIRNGVLFQTTAPARIHLPNQTSANKYFFLHLHFCCVCIGTAEIAQLYMSYQVQQSNFDNQSNADHVISPKWLLHHFTSDLHHFPAAQPPYPTWLRRSTFPFQSKSHCEVIPSVLPANWDAFMGAVIVRPSAEITYNFTLGPFVIFLNKWMAIVLLPFSFTKW